MSGGSASGHAGSSASGALRVAKMPAGFAEKGAHERRIAGRVTFAGKPFAGATVRLTAWGGMIEPPDSERTTGPDGAFDFGMREPGSYDVAASAPGKVAAIVQVPLANPAARPPADALELVLAACEAQVVGTVRDASGGPIVRARVRRQGITGIDTDETGAYEICVPPGQLEVHYSADGYGAVVIGMFVDLRTRRDVVLVPEAVVQGIAIDEAGTPVADARITAAPVEWGPERASSRSDMTGADGRFQITQVMPGRVRLWAYAEDMSSEGGQEVTANVGTSPDVVVKLVHEPSIAGTVMRDGKPVAGVPLQAVRKSPVGRSWNATSQEDGSFILTRVPAGDVLLTSSKVRVASPTNVHVDKSITGVVVEIASLATIKGRVTRDGIGIADANVCCVQGPTGAQQRTDNDGNYIFEGVLPGNYELAAQTHFAFSEATKLTVTGVEDHVVDLDMLHGAEIRGTVVDEKGTPLHGLHVKFQHPTTGDLCRAISDEKGRFRCSQMTGGAKYAGAVYPTQALDVPLPTPPDKPYPAIDLKDGKSLVEGVTIVVVHGQGQIRGRVVDTKGAPIADARVRANNEDRFSTWLSLPSSTTDVNGNFVLDDLADGSYVLQARSTDGGTGTAKGVVGGAAVTVVVALPGSIEGTLTGFAGSPVIYVTPIGEYSELNPGTVTGNAYRVGGLKPGKYMINAQTTYEGDARAVEVRAGEVTKLDLAAKGRGSVDVTITDYATGAGVPNIQCHVVIAVNGMQGLTNWDLSTLPRSDANGRLRLDPIPAGNIIIGCISNENVRSAPSAELVLAQGTNAKVAMQSVRRSSVTWGTTGIDVDWRVVAPRISAVAPKSSAADAGILAGDVIIAIDDKPIGTLDGAGAWFLIQDHDIGAKFPIGITRGAQKLRVVVEMRPGS